MTHRVGIWIDDRKAVIVSSSAERLTSLTLESGEAPHGRDSGSGERSTPAIPLGGQAEKRYAPRYGEHLDQYYDEVISHLGQPDALLIFGPGEAKRQLEQRLSRSKALPACIVGIETTDRLTDPQIVAKVRQHFGIASPGVRLTRSGTQ